MDASKLSWIAHFIWGIADDMLRDLYVRGKYLDVILLMTALARVMTALLKDDTELFRQFSDNKSFRRWLTDTMFRLTYEERPA